MLLSYFVYFHWKVLFKFYLNRHEESLLRLWQIMTGEPRVLNVHRIFSFCFLIFPFSLSQTNIWTGDAGGHSESWDEESWELHRYTASVSFRFRHFLFCFVFVWCCLNFQLEMRTISLCSSVENKGINLFVWMNGSWRTAETTVQSTFLHETLHLKLVVEKYRGKISSLLLTYSFLTRNNTCEITSNMNRCKTMFLFLIM